MFSVWVSVCTYTEPRVAASASSMPRGNPLAQTEIHMQFYPVSESCIYSRKMLKQHSGKYPTGSRMTVVASKSDYIVTYASHTGQSCGRIRCQGRTNLRYILFIGRDLKYEWEREWPVAQQAATLICNRVPYTIWIRKLFDERLVRGGPLKEYNNNRIASRALADPIRNLQ